MRFITEFELKFPYQLSVLETYKVKGQMLDIGNQIGDAFDWQNEHDEEKDKYSLEIEAFPMGKWVEFRDKIIEESRKGRSNRTNNIMQMFKELESYGTK